jgi:hypothetical protein
MTPLIVATFPTTLRQVSLPCHLTPTLRLLPWVCPVVIPELSVFALKVNVRKSPETRKCPEPVAEATTCFHGVFSEFPKNPQSC